LLAEIFLFNLSHSRLFLLRIIHVINNFPLDPLRLPREQERLRNAEAVFCLALFWLQVARRLYECLFVTKYSKSRMLFLHYLAGALYYVAVG